MRSTLQTHIVALHRFQVASHARRQPHRFQANRTAGFRGISGLPQRSCAQNAPSLGSQQLRTANSSATRRFACRISCCVWPALRPCGTHSPGPPRLAGFKHQKYFSARGRLRGPRQVSSCTSHSNWKVRTTSTWLCAAQGFGVLFFMVFWPVLRSAPSPFETTFPYGPGNCNVGYSIRARREDGLEEDGSERKTGQK